MDDGNERLTAQMGDIGHRQDLQSQRIDRLEEELKTQRATHTAAMLSVHIATPRPVYRDGSEEEFNRAADQAVSVLRTDKNTDVEKRDVEQALMPAFQRVKCGSSNLRPIPLMVKMWTRCSLSDFKGFRSRHPEAKLPQTSASDQRCI